MNYLPWLHANGTICTGYAQIGPSVSASNETKNTQQKVYAVMSYSYIIGSDSLGAYRIWPSHSAL